MIGIQVYFPLRGFSQGMNIQIHSLLDFTPKNYRGGKKKKKLTS